MSDLFLEKMEADALGILANTPGLALAKILRADEGLTEADIAQKLVTLTGGNAGLGIVVLQAEIVSAEKNLPGPVMRASIGVQVIEAVTINRSSNGTGLKASIAALRVAGALHQQRIGTTLLYADKNPVEPLPGKKGFVSYLVTLFAEQNGSGSAQRVSQLSFAIDNASDLVITTATAGAAIHYTTDGSFPGPSNPAALLYSGPIGIENDMVLRAGAYLSPLNPSDISEVTITISDEQISLNGELITLGGESVLL